MAQRIKETEPVDQTRCRQCRFWFERCCHALALLEGNDQAPQQCVHFLTGGAPPHRVMEVWP
jgi:hypothetical protein